MPKTHSGKASGHSPSTSPVQVVVQALTSPSSVSYWAQRPEAHSSSPVSGLQASPGSKVPRVPGTQQATSSPRLTSKQTSEAPQSSLEKQPSAEISSQLAAVMSGSASSPVWGPRSTS